MRNVREMNTLSRMQPVGRVNADPEKVGYSAWSCRSGI